MTDADVAVRPLDPDRFAEFRSVIDYAFHPDAGPQRYEDEEFDRIAERYGAFDGDDLVSVCAHYDFDARLRGEWTPMAGLAAVATPPEHRRRGYVRALIDDALDRWRDEFPVAALWPFSTPYYRQFGWATANRSVKYTCPIDQLKFARGSATGRARPVDAAEWADLQGVHEAYAADRNLALRREGERWWRERVLSADEDDRPWAYAWERDGDVRGYVVYEFEDGSAHAGKRLSVNDLAYADFEAFRGLLGFLADHDSQADEVAFSADARADLLDLVPDPGSVDCKVRPGPMVRIVDVADALSACPYPDGASADLTLRVADGTAGWNDGTFRLRVDDGEGDCERAGDGAVGDELTGSEGSDERIDGEGSDERIDGEAGADLTVGVGTLSQLLVGYHDADEARRLGDLSVADEAAAGALADLFPSETVYLRTFF